MTRIVCRVENCDNHQEPDTCQLDEITVKPSERQRGTDDTECGDFQPVDGRR